ncbi:MAG: mismatch-specific DNA-glycosylase [Chloroflexota bacterium]|nr:mismatch-specific DNA-glycosylase [Chloroflexota bacterium]MDE2910862.1 mismatch-specific DNA-glycosylase [Chloroflexota bacterium]
MNDVLPDVLDHGLIVVFCGTAASAVSARHGAYYANPTNAFWTTLHATRLTPRRLNPGNFRELLDLRIGLTDLAKTSMGSDRCLQPRDMLRERLGRSIRLYQPQIVAFTSKAAWRGWQGLASAEAVAYGWQAETLGETAFYVLPSPSGAARGYWDTVPWRALADEYRRRLKMT